RRLQRGAEGAGAVGQRAVGRQDGQAVAAGEMHRPAVARRRVVELVEGGDGEGEGAAGRGAGGSADREVRGVSGTDGDGIAGAGDGTGRRIGGGDRLVAGGVQRGAEGAHPTAQRAVAGQGGGPVAARKVDRAAVAGGGVPERVLRGHREGEAV